MKVVINDACILIALCELDMGAALRDAGITLHTPTLVFGALAGQRKSQLCALLYQGVLSLHAVTQGYTEAPGRTAAEQSGLCLAARLGADIMSTNEAVWTAAEAQGTACRGMFWLFDQLIRARCMDFHEACMRMQRMMGKMKGIECGEGLFGERDMRLIHWVARV